MTVQVGRRCGGSTPKSTVVYVVQLPDMDGQRNGMVETNGQGWLGRENPWRHAAGEGGGVRQTGFITRVEVQRGERCTEACRKLEGNVG